jgi:hypothetical protein
LLLPFLPVKWPGTFYRPFIDLDFEDVMRLEEACLFILCSLPRLGPSTMLRFRQNTLSNFRRSLPFIRSSAPRCYASVTDIKRYPKPGDALHGFTLQRSEHFPELELTALRFSHDKTGADYLHVARDDSNNVFSIGFKTNPPDATGVPHILEHTTLCGSQR